MKHLAKPAALALAVLAACADPAAGPPKASRQAPSISGPLASVSTTTYAFNITINPKKTTTFQLGGGNSLVFPAKSLCDVSSTYGPISWDDPCTPATKTTSIAVTAWLDASGHPRVDFTPSVRFVPSTDPAKWVVLSFVDSAAAADPAFNIDYCPSATSPCYDEALFDSSLVTYKNPTTGRLTRRIKHFSGYNVAAGYADSSGTMMMNRVGPNGASLSTASGSLQSVTPVYRNHPLPDHPTRSADIGPAGGQLSLPQAGLTLVVPAGAVSSLTHFSVTSVSGRFVAYDFEPHGMHFAMPLAIQQDLRDLSHRPGLTLMGGYFASDSQLDEANGTALVDETLTTQLDVTGNQASFPVRHFSGYMLASGRGGGR